MAGAPTTGTGRAEGEAWAELAVGLVGVADSGFSRRMERRTIVLVGHLAAGGLVGETGFQA